MTVNQMLSHTEQMEACRAEFHSLWENLLLKRLTIMSGHQMTQREKQMAYDIAWVAFLGATLYRKSS